MFFVMGITWVSEPLSFYFDNKPIYFWLTFDCINLLMGVPIFIIFVCNKNTLKLLNEKFNPSKEGDTSTKTQTVNYYRHFSTQLSKNELLMEEDNDELIINDK